MADSHPEADFYLKILEALQRDSRLGLREIPVVLVSQALKAEDGRRLHKTGVVDTICYPLEVWQATSAAIFTIKKEEEANGRDHPEGPQPV